ncbi:MAG: SDR family oxidoreductase [Candidatus Competibacteraceae bacterium]
MSEASQATLDISPSRYIEKYDLRTGAVIDEQIKPEQLLVHAHRDFHFMDFEARRIMSRVMRTTGDRELARNKVRRMRRWGYRMIDRLARVIGKKKAEKVARALLGLAHHNYHYRFKPLPVTGAEAEKRIRQLRQDAQAQFAKTMVDGKPALRVLLTGGTGFIGQEIIWQAARDDTIVEMVILIRPKTIKDRKTGQVERIMSPAERGAELLRLLWLETPEQQAKFRFVAGDIEQPMLGVAPAELTRLEQTITHVVHSAASVSFDDTYEATYQSNVTGTQNALVFSLHLQQTPGSPFVEHIGIETSYIHGRQMREPSQEDTLVFPSNYYNNYYELTKAMASIETEKSMLLQGLRVLQLCPAIVIGKLRTGDNRGDTKVVNAPINMFGRIHETIADSHSSLAQRSVAGLMARLACVFPADPGAQLNLITVDWVVRGIMATLYHPEAVGERIHLASDKHLTPKAIGQIFKEELGLSIHYVEPTLFRTLLLPVFVGALNLFKRNKQANALGKLATLFGGYAEWDQPIHEVGKDLEVLKMQGPRPDMEYAFRMLCRHNLYIQHFGQVRDSKEISRREKQWKQFIDDLEKRTGRRVGDISAEEFHKEAAAHLDFVQ